MKQLKIVFRFELNNYLRKKSFLVLTFVLMAAIAILLSWPRISQGLFGSDTASSQQGAEKATAIAVLDESGTAASNVDFYNATLAEKGFEFVRFAGSKEQLRAQVEDGTFSEGVVFAAPLQYERVVKEIGMYDHFSTIFSQTVLENYRQNTLEEYGISEQQVGELLNAEVVEEVTMLGEGKDQMQSFFYTYMMIFMLYFAIVMYGQFIASSVATEKSTRTMELLITATRPTSLMFGKVFGAGLAGLLQMALILGSGYLFYNLNASFYTENAMVQSVFGMPLSLMLYVLLFFILGFFLYAFLYAALASLVSRMEDLATATMPVTYIFVIAFMVVMFSMASGNVDSGLMVVASFVPLTSPMAMFTRVAMGNVPGWQIVISVVILLATTVGTGMLAAAIYRLGVLMYGNVPKPKEIIKMLKANKV